MVLQLKRQLFGAQRPASHHPWRSLWPPGGLLRVLCFNHLRAGGPALAGPCLPHFTRACCVYAPCLLSHFGSACVSMYVCIWSMLVACLRVMLLEVRTPNGVRMESTHIPLAVALMWLKMTCCPVWGACVGGVFWAASWAIGGQSIFILAYRTVIWTQIYPPNHLVT